MTSCWDKWFKNSDSAHWTKMTMDLNSIIDQLETGDQDVALVALQIYNKEVNITVYVGLLAVTLICLCFLPYRSWIAIYTQYAYRLFYNNSPQCRAILCRDRLAQSILNRSNVSAVRWAIIFLAQVRRYFVYLFVMSTASPLIRMQRWLISCT